MKTRAGFNFTEIMLAVFILAMALLPIINILSRTTGMSREEKTQAAAAGYAGKVMNRYLYEVQWSDLTSGFVDDNRWLDDDSKTGIEFDWKGDVLDAWPSNQPMAVKRTRYHSGCSGACTGGIEDLPKNTPREINPVFCGRVGMVFKTVSIKFKWKGPGESTYNDLHQAVLVVRRGMLDEANISNP